MKRSINPEADVLYLPLTDVPIEESEKRAPGVVLGYLPLERAGACYGIRQCSECIPL